MDQEADAGDDENHHAGKRIEQEAPVGNKIRKTPAGHLHRAGRHHSKQDQLDDALVWRYGKNCRTAPSCVNERQAHAADAENTDAGFGSARANKKHQRRGGQREKRNQPEMRQESIRWASWTFRSCRSYSESRGGYHFNKSISSAKNRFAVAEERDDDAKPYGGFRSRIGNDEKRENLPRHIAVQSWKMPPD